MKTPFVFRILAGLLLLADAWAHDSQALYLGNEGVLITHGDDKVLFDAFYAEAHGLYVLVPEAVLV